MEENITEIYETFNKAVSLEKSDIEKSISYYKYTLDKFPGFYAATINLANIYESQGKTKEAIELFEKSITIPQDLKHFLLVMKNLARIYISTYQFEYAYKLLNLYLIHDTESTDVLQELIIIRQKICKWPVLFTEPKISKSVLLNSIGPISSLSLFDDPSVLLHNSQNFIKKNIPELYVPHNFPKYNHDKIRIGYISCDFKRHVCGFLMREMFALHKRNKFIVYGFDNSIEDNSDVRSEILNGFDVTFNIRSMTDENVVEQIRSCEIDILVDLMGLTHESRYKVVAKKVAPIQISYLGYLGTTSIDANDYILCDEFVIPKEYSIYYSENPLYLPCCFQVNNRRRRPSTNIKSREEYGLPTTGFVYCVINNSYKINLQMFSIWCKILSKVPDSVLWILESNPCVRTNLTKEASKYNIEASRLVFAELEQPEIYLSRFQYADLFLDTYPYNSGATASDVLWMGIPILTFPGKSYVSRMAGSLLLHSGLEELIVDSLEKYQSEAIRYANEPEKLKMLKTKIINMRNTNKVFDTSNFVREFEKQLLKIHACRNFGKNSMKLLLHDM